MKRSSTGFDILAITAIVIFLMLCLWTLLRSGAPGPIMVTEAAPTIAATPASLVRVARPTSPFSSLVVEGIAHVVAKHGAPGIAISGASHLAPYVEVQQDADTLRVSGHRLDGPHGPVTIYVSSPEISSVELSGTSDVDLSNVDPDSLHVQVEGASRLSCVGHTQSVDAHVSGTSSLDAKELKTQSADIEASGASSLRLGVSQAATINASGTSRVDIYGNPATTENVSGVATVKLH